MKVIDFDIRGNSIRLYLGEDSLENWWGDDWDDVPYEHNAGRVYHEYIKSVMDINLPYTIDVLEPCSGWETANSHWSKEDMQYKRVPCVVIGENEADTELEDPFAYISDSEFARMVGDVKTLKIYMGDSEEKIKSLIDNCDFKDKKLITYVIKEVMYEST